MDGHQFDKLARRLATGTSRRGLLKTALAGLLGGAAGVTAARSVAAATPCTSGRQCLSRLCVDGFCCNGVCTGQCEACNLPGREGTCSPVTGRPVGNRQACPGTGVCQATCDGVRRTSCAAFPGSGVTCGAATCRDGWQRTFGCGGNGTCHLTTTSCGLFTCTADGTGCRTSCASDAECVGAAFCAGGVCQGDKPLGQPCAAPDQCQSGFCVDGVCCITACAGVCQACNLSGNVGFCTEEADGATCQDGICCDGDCINTQTDLEHCGACDNACRLVPAAGSCEQDPICAAGQCTFTPLPANTVCRAAADICDVAEACDGTSLACPPNAFAPPTQVCDDGNACTANDRCQNGACLGTPAVTCATPGVCETAPGTCDPQNGTCSYPDAPDNTGCGAGQACCGGTCTDVTTTTNCGACGNACGAGQGCVAGACQSCGGDGLLCCAGQTCDPGLVCVVPPGFEGICLDCGEVGEPCCPTILGGACNTGAKCQSGGSGLQCVACGGPSQICCGGLAGQTGTTCNPGLTCFVGSCFACGEAGEPCCPPLGSCGGGLTCNAGTCGP